MKQFWNIAKYILTFASLTGVLFGVFRLIDTIQDGQKEIGRTIENVSIKVDSVIVMQEYLQRSVSKNQDAIIENTKAIETGQRTTRYLIEHQAEMTRDQQLDFFDFYLNEIKKNEKRTALRE